MNLTLLIGLPILNIMYLINNYIVGYNSKTSMYLALIFNILVFLFSLYVIGFSYQLLIEVLIFVALYGWIIKTKS